MLTRMFLYVSILCLSLPADAAEEGKKDEPKKVEMKGALEVGIVAIGGETTGTILKTKDGTFELDLAKNKELQQKAIKLNGKEVAVSGTLVIRPGVEVKERKIITVTTLEEAK